MHRPKLIRKTCVKNAEGNKIQTKFYWTKKTVQNKETKSAGRKSAYEKWKVNVDEKLSCHGHTNIGKKQMGQRLQLQTKAFHIFVKIQVCILGRFILYICNETIYCVQIFVLPIKG